MNVIPSAAVLSLVLVLSGCATSTQVQEMIDASRQDYLKRSDSHTASIDLLKKSSIAALEKNKANAAAIAELNAELDSAQAQLKLIRGYADAAKIMSAANTVKVADLEDAIEAFKETVEKNIGQLDDIDNLYEKVMLDHYQTIVDSTTQAMHALKMNGVGSSNDAPVELSAPIEIIAPDTSAAANGDALSANIAPSK